jgi:2-polyprenyl-6-hydroxyphenyl methylase/3-demethylubiquinone-9 3-methyltransferase
MKTLLLTVLIAAIASAIALMYPILTTKPYDDRLGVIQESFINNEQYDYQELASSWWDTSIDSWTYGLHRINNGRYQYFLKKLKQHYGQKLTENTLQVLDVGCGGGILTELVAKENRNFNVLGIDISKRSIETAAKHAKENNVTNVSYKYGSVYDIPVDSSSMDIIIMSDVLEHFLDLNKVMSEVKRVLRPGGILVYDTINRTLKSHILFVYVFETARVIPPGTHDWRLFITPEEMKQLIEKHGLKAADYSEMRGLEPTFESPVDVIQKLWKSLRTLNLGHIMTEVNECSDLDMTYMGYAIKSNSE